jgi:hypothetical protein
VLLADLSKEIENIDTKLRLYADDISPKVDALEDPVERRALKLRYFELNSMANCAVLIGYGRQHFYEVLSRAERKICA